MSGGAFDYLQYSFVNIYERIESELENQGKELPKEDLWGFDEYYEKHPKEKFKPIHSEDVQNILKDAIKILKKAEIYAQRVDWFLSGDDSEDRLISRLKSDLEIFHNQ
jgi:hypothetical protein